MSNRNSILIATTLLIAVGSATVAWQYATRDKPPQSTATYFARIVAAQGIWDDRWRKHDAKLDALTQELATEAAPGKRLELRRLIAEQMLLAGHAEAAIAEFGGLIEDADSRVPAAWLEQVRFQRIIAWLRLGEIQNCLWQRARASCVFPIDADAVHRARLGAQQAHDELLKRLQASDLPADRADTYRWLLNVAAMNLGTYPAGVPDTWLIPPAAFTSPDPLPRFEDIAQAAGVDTLGLSGGAIVDDFDGDGLLDIVASSWGAEDPLVLYRNLGAMRFELLDGIPDGINGGLNLIHADYDNDGDRDLFILRGAWLHQNGRHPNTLLRNKGNGYFEDVTESAGVLSYFPSQTAVFADFDNDGWLDLFVGNEIVDAAGWDGTAKAVELYRNLGNGSFEDVAAHSGIDARGLIKGTTAGDVDGDGWVDLFVSIWGAENRLYRNLGGEGQSMRFREISDTAGIAEPVASFPAWFWDVDNDGDQDLFVAGYRGDVGTEARSWLGMRPHGGEAPALYMNDGTGRFTNAAIEAGLDLPLLAMGSNFGDLDNDGWLDMLVGTGAPPLETLVPNRAFRNRGDGRFADVTTDGGFGHLQKGHGVAFGDLDGDGDQDIYATIGGAYASDRFWNALYQNPGNQHAWITLKLKGHRSNRDGIGSRVTVTTDTGRSISRTVGSGGSFGGSSIQLEIGLAEATSIRSLEVRWSGSGLIQQFDGPIATNAVYQITEGQQITFVGRPDTDLQQGGQQ